MYSTCLLCTKDLGANDVVETLPIGRRLAFDAAQGRLWVVCRHCAKWNLVPFDTRLETIDDCERLFRDTPTRYSTDNIGLARVKEGLELVRIGQAPRPEFAGWRYGESVKRRRRYSVALVGVGSVAIAAGLIVAAQAAGIVAAGGMGSLFYKGSRSVMLRRRSRVPIVDPGNQVRRTLSRTDLQDSRMMWDDGELVLRVPRPWTANGIALEWRGQSIAPVGQRVMGGLNTMDGAPKDLGVAVKLLGDQSGDLTEWMLPKAEEHAKLDLRATSSPILKSRANKYWEGFGRAALQLSRLPVHERLAVEMYFAESAERTWLEGELTLLEREWRQAEELAKLADGLALGES